MRKLSTIFSEYLGPEAVKAGGRRAPATETTIGTTIRQKDRLVQNLMTQSRYNTYLVFMMSAMLLALFVVCLYFAIHFRNDPQRLKLTIGGSLLGLLAITQLLFSIWKEKSKMDLLITLIPEITPQEAKEVVEILYYKRKSHK